MSVSTEELILELSKLSNCSNIDFERSEQNSLELSKLLHPPPSHSQLQKARCLIEKLFEKTGIRFDKGFFKVKKSIRKWISEYESGKIANKVYPYSFDENLSSDMIVKVEDKEDAIREYYVGMQINKLLEQVPNFVYTFGAIKSGNVKDKNVALILQHLNAKSLSDVLEEMTDVSEFLELYCQLLIALELAQRECSFCHYDLHTDNVLVLELKKEHSYTVSFESKTFKVKTKRIPIIIDFGLSSVYTKYVVGNNDLRYAGIYTTGISGEDMYKLLFTSTYSCNDQVFEKMRDIFSFYKSDPYDTKNLSREDMNNIYHSTFLNKIPLSSVASFIPLEMLDWICDRYTLQTIKRQTRRFTRSSKNVELIHFTAPDATEFIALCSHILSTPINNRGATKEFIARVDEFTESIETYNGFHSYMKKLYSIPISVSTLKKLKRSKMYDFYSGYASLVAKTKRWAHTILTFQ